MFGNAIETIVLSTKARKTPAEATSRTVRGATVRRLRNTGCGAGAWPSRRSARSMQLQTAHGARPVCGGPQHREREQADERRGGRDVERDQPRQRREARGQQRGDVDPAETGVVR